MVLHPDIVVDFLGTSSLIRINSMSRPPLLELSVVCPRGRRVTVVLRCRRRVESCEGGAYEKPFVRIRTFRYLDDKRVLLVAPLLKRRILNTP
jgi:hypothetical protein